MIRTPKEWTECCSACGGAGKIQKREYFQLWTQEEYRHHMGEEFAAMRPKLDVPERYEQCTAVGGAGIHAAVEEGIGLARQLGRPVAFEFNGEVVRVSAGSDADRIVRAWWQAVYHETPEESFAKR